MSAANGHSTGHMDLKLVVWRQKNAADKGRFETYTAKGISADSSFLEMLDQVNEELIKAGKDPITFDHDCREGICGSCGIVINGRPHGPHSGVAACQLHMRSFKNGDEIVIEPFRATAFPVMKDLMVDRAAFDRIIQKGGYISVDTGSSVDANAIAIPKAMSDRAFEAATCIGCGACVASCKNASAMLFVSAKVAHLAMVPQGEPERRKRVRDMVAQMDAEGFGNCTNTGSCEATCPKGISLSNIALLNREYLAAMTVPTSYE